MVEAAKLEKLDLNQLVALALYIEEYNIHFFRGWANRLRSYDAKAVSLLRELADDAKIYRDSLYASSRRLFPYGLPELEPELYKAVHHNLNLPDLRFFVVSDGEAKQILSAALKLQQETIELLEQIDSTLRRKYSTGINLDISATHYQIPEMQYYRGVYEVPRV